jgi:RNA ligase (TIGR02306 family)
MKLASIEVIADVRPHGNADRLEIATVLGWQTVVRKGEFKTGDRCVFIVIDTILPPAPWSAFLAHPAAPDLPIRLKTAKLRGEFSQGLALPLTVLPEHMRDWQNGADVGGELGVKKYEKEIPAVLSGEAKSAFPTHFAPRTDEDNGLSHPSIVEMVLAERELVITLKLDGSSCTVVWENGKGIVDVCSRNLSLRDDGKNGFWRAVKKLKLDRLSGYLEWGPRTVLQGELMGPGVQGNQLKLTEPTLFLFQVHNEATGWLAHSGVRRVAEHIGAEVVPQIEVPIGWTNRDLAQLQSVADAQKLPDGSPAEGIVVRPARAIAFGNGRPAGFKIINRNYGE